MPAMLDAAPTQPLGNTSPRPPGPGRRSALQSALAQIEFVYDPLAAITRRFAKYGDAYWVDQPTGPLFVFKHPDHVKDVLVTNASAFDKQHVAFRRLSLVLGDALLTSDGERWRRQRRLVQPAFARPRLAAYSGAMVDEARRSAQRLSAGGTFDLGREMNRLTLAIVTRTLFGQALDEGGKTARAILELNRWFSTPPILTPFQFKAKQRFQEVVDTLDSVIEGLIASKRAALATNPTSSDDLLSALLSVRDEQDERLSERELRDQLLTLYLAGHETTSHALTWTLYLLSQHPDACARLRAEHDRVLGGRLPTFDDVPALPYTECVLKEALRMYPPAFIVPRNACEDTTVGPYAVPKGSEVAVWIYVMQRDPRWFPEPERFRPERFEPEREAERPKYAYIPFGAGQRACIGQLFAMLEAQLILATLVPRLDFAYARRRPPRASRGLTLAPAGGMPMRVRARS
jgi:cytochrome P450